MGDCRSAVDTRSSGNLARSASIHDHGRWCSRWAVHLQCGGGEEESRGRFVWCDIEGPIFPIHLEPLLHLNDLLQDVSHVFAHTKVLLMPALTDRKTRSLAPVTFAVWRIRFVLVGRRGGSIGQELLILVLHDDAIDVNSTVSPRTGRGCAGGVSRERRWCMGGDGAGHRVVAGMTTDQIGDIARCR